MTAIPFKPHFSNNTAYVGVPAYSDDPSPGYSDDYFKSQKAPQQIDLYHHPQITGHRSWWKTLLIQGFSALWLVPVGVLLYLNLHGHILGASAWCPGGKCFPQMFNPVTSVPQELAAKHDHDTHNLNGALQLVAKALEVWFILIATWLVYLVTMFLAGRKSGLPIAYITRPNEFAELAGVLDPLLWRTLPKPFRKDGPKKARLRVWVFVGFTVALGCLCNLMGPATAVLVLPTLQWLETEKVEPTTLKSINSAKPPAVRSWAYYSAPHCTEELWTNGNYSCTYNPWATAMDSWIQSYMSSQLTWNGIAQQDMVSFAFNSTAWYYDDGTVSDYLYWAPSRTMMSLLSLDYLSIQNMSLGVPKDQWVLPEYYDSYIPLNNTVQLDVERTGPVFGVAANMWLGYDNKTYWDSVIDDNRAVRCWNDYNVGNTPLARNVMSGNYTKCVQWGSGWGYDYQTTGFTIEGMWKSWAGVFGPDAKFDIWNSANAAFLPNGTMPDGFSAECLPVNEQVDASINCNWDEFFKVDNNSAMATRSSMVNTIQITANMEPADDHPTTIDLMFDFVTYVNYTSYSLDPSPQSNPLIQVTNPDLPMSGKAIEVSPSWTIAAWSADLDGLIRANRSSTLSILQALDTLWESDMYNSADPLAASYPTIDYIGLLPIIQTLSLLEFTIDNTTATKVDADHPQFHRSARINVWAYGMSSRTSWLGVAVALLGVLTVVFQTLLGIIDRRPYRSPTQLLVAALEHSPSEEFRGKSHDERAIARTPFTVRDHAHGHASTFKFEKSL
ncbi:hypothetical protein PRZ48_013715 [Zasmidium cellare]|uniref:Uncharacterized protein n=1 Tax=Zasmidium cellare TaxID=395010 RepID=A0ABR0E1T8_ZASCE|nr:hypothetical protein PRZ48_013715 [Zasmidium cellare]